jgi:Transposase family tnp2
VSDNEEDEETVSTSDLYENDESAELFPADMSTDIEGDKKLYDDCEITLNESMIMIMKIAQMFNLPQRAIKFILKFTRLHMPKKAKFYDSTYLLKNIFSRKYKFEKKSYCKKCKKLIKEENGQLISCCGEKFSSELLLLPILDQIKCLFERKKFRELMFDRSREKIEPENIESVCDAELYKVHSEFLSQKTNFSMCYYADGVQLWKSSKSSLWPFILTFNELPYKERYKIENMILLGLWYDGTQPDFNTWLAETYDSFRTLLENGVDVKFIDETGVEQTVNVKGLLLFGTADAPARAKVAKVNQYNGRFGCTVCYQSGSARKNAQNITVAGPYVFPFEEIVHFRTSADTRELGNRASRMVTILYGIKGVSFLFQVMSHPMEALALDPMHLLYSGIMTKLTDLWFNLKYKNEKYSLTNYLPLVDNYMKCCKKPFFLNRSPRAIGEHAAFYTSAEFKSFFHYFGIPILSQVMKRDGYLEHFFCLVEAICLLNQDSISATDIQCADEKLKKFVKDFAKHYGVNNMNYNVHSLLHLPLMVQRLGPLYEFSCFPFESANGIMKKMVKGTRYAEEIIAQEFVTRQSLPLFLEKLPADSKILEFLEEAKHTNQLKKIEKFSDNIAALGGKYKLYTELGQEYTKNIRSALFNSGMNITGTGKILCFHRIQINKRIFTAKSHSLLPGGSHCVEYCGKKIGLIETFLKIVECSCKTYTGCKCASDVYAVINECMVQAIPGLHLNNFINRLKISDDYVAVRVSELKNLCVLINGDEDNTYYAKKVNNVELE